MVFVVALVGGLVPFVDLGNLYEKRGDWPSAFEEWQDAMQIERNPTGAYKIACCYMCVHNCVSSLLLFHSSSLLFGSLLRLVFISSSSSAVCCRWGMNCVHVDERHGSELMLEWLPKCSGGGGAGGGTSVAHVRAASAQLN